MKPEPIFNHPEEPLSADPWPGIAELYSAMRRKTSRRLGQYLSGQFDTQDDVFHDAFASFLYYYARGNITPGKEAGYLWVALRRRIYREWDEQKLCIPVPGLDVKARDDSFWIKAERDRISRDVLELLRQDILPPKEREVFGMVRLLGLPLRETARRLRVDPASIKRRLDSADRRLRPILEPLWKEVRDGD